jgi:hypothetical protein
VLDYPVYNLNYLIHAFYEEAYDDIVLSLDERLFSNIKKIVNYTQDSQDAHRKFKDE